MANVIGVAGKLPEEHLIRDMKPGQVGYTVPWAYDKNSGELNEEFGIGEKGGTMSLRVECVKPGRYSLTFEEPRYRNVIIR